MINVSVARRYARALLDAAGDSADQVLTQLEAVVAFLNQTPTVFEALCSPALTKAQRHAITAGLISASPGMHGAVANLLKLLTDRSRFPVLPSLARLFREQVDAKLGRVRGKVTSAVPLSAPQLDNLRVQLERLAQRKVILESTIDKSLLGGVVAQVGTHMYDGSLRAQLNDMAQKLTAPVR